MLDDVRQLRQLVALASHDTLGRAADSLGITKSALSQSIQRMEDIYGLPLFQRGRNGISPTVYGRHLIATAKESLALLHQSDTDLAMLRNLEAGRLVIGCDPLITELLLAPSLATLAKQHPGLRCVMKSGFWQDLRICLSEGGIDLFVGLKPDESILEFELREITLPPIEIYCRKSHPLTQKATPKITEIMDYPLVGPAMPKWFFERMAFAAPEIHKNASDLFVTSNDGAVIRAIVRDSDAVTGGFRAVFMPDCRSSAFCTLPFSQDPFGTPLPGVLVLRRDELQSPAAASLAAIIQERARTLSKATCPLGDGETEGAFVKPD